MHTHEHGGNIYKMAQEAGCDVTTLMDFSVNLRPEGTPSFIREALQRSLENIHAYPAPQAEALCLAAAKHFKMSPKCFVFGNGSNELIHAVARVLAAQSPFSQAIQQAYIFEPAFSEYALACKKAKLQVHSLWSGVPFASGTELGYAEIVEAMRAQVASMKPCSLVFFANPANPSGFYVQRKDCLSLIQQRDDVFWIVDEAFIDYVGSSVSLVPSLPENALVLQSLTKFYAVAGVRLGYLVAQPAVAARIIEDLPVWTVNSLATAAALAVFAAPQDFADQTRQENAQRREHLMKLLTSLHGIRVYPSAANYVLFQCAQPAPHLPAQLLQHHRIAIRDCSNYYGLEDKTWFRVAVRLLSEHEHLVNALQQVLSSTKNAQQPHINTDFVDFSLPPLLSTSKKCALPKKTPALMLLGTSSNAGKSILTAAFCRIFQQDGYRVAPFKSQNMSLHSGVTLTGEEMGRAQIVQAQGARLDPEARMNPILLKPHSDTGSQVIVMGKALGHMRVAEYFSKKKELWHSVTAAYDSLAGEHDILVLEGAGSPAEINLKEHDIVNMRMAEYAEAAVLLVGDIDRGGVYASFLGTWMTFTESEKKRLLGYVVNRFRGDASFLAPAHAYMLSQTQVPVLGVVPYVHDLGIPEEDMAGFTWNAQENFVQSDENTLEIAVLMLRHVSNFTDIHPLLIEKGVRVRPVRSVQEWGNPHVVIVPGSKSVVADLEIMRSSGLAEKIQAHAAQGKWIFGICGGLQMLGKEIRDPYSVESTQSVVQGLGLMALTSTFAKEKTLKQVKNVSTPLGVTAKGYEIHHGLTTHDAGVQPLFLRADTTHVTEQERICGYVQAKCWATYVHGIFDNDVFRQTWIAYLRQDVGLPLCAASSASYDLEHALDRLADVVRASIDMSAVYESLGLPCKS